MTFQEEIEKLILLDKKGVLKEIESLHKSLGIRDKIKHYAKHLDDLDSVYVVNLDVEKNWSDILIQAQENKHKKLELWCKINGDKKYIKSLGTIEMIGHDQIKAVAKFIWLIRLVKKINEAIYYASRINEILKL